MFEMDFDEISTELENQVLFEPFLYGGGVDVPHVAPSFAVPDYSPNGELLCDEATGFELGACAMPMNANDSTAASASPCSDIIPYGTSGPIGASRKESRPKDPLSANERSPPRYRPTSRNAARERSRVKSLRTAFLELQNSLPSVPPNTKLSKLDVLVLATTYIAHLMKTLDDAKAQEDKEAGSTPHHLNYLINADHFSVGISQSPSEGRHHRLHEKGYLHPVRKWPMRSRLYAGAFDDKCNNASPVSQTAVALPDINYTMPVLDSNLDMLFSCSTSM